MSTIQDVAKQAGVSTSTVSNVLNGRTDLMRRETLTRVETAISALSYRPNRAAQQLKTGNNPMLGLLVPSIANPMYGYIAREIETVAQQQYGHRVMLGNTYRSKEIETGFFDDLFSHGVRGAIMISSQLDEQHLDRVVQRGLVAVSYDRPATPGASPALDHVTVDNAAAARMATEHLISRGHQRLVFATAAGQTMSRREKVKGFLAAAQSAGLADSAHVLEGSIKAGYGDSEMADLGRMLAARIALDPRRPTGIVAVNDLMAFGLMAGLRDAGLSVPADVSLVGIDGLFLSALMNPGLTTVRLPVPQMASKLVERVIARMADPSTKTDEFIFQPDLVERASVAVPPPPARRQA
ncbi:PurR Transcriptional regulators [Burkholderiaceae bacterium]